jgi:fatty acid desaturase
MHLWKKLYNTVWLAFFSCVMLPRWMGAKIGLTVHVLLGLGLLLMTVKNARQLAAIEVPDRLKRISKVTRGFAIFQLVSGLALGALHHLFPDVPYAAPFLHGAHAVCALAILAQASSVATAYDMWEEKEYAIKK